MTTDHHSTTGSASEQAPTVLPYHQPYRCPSCAGVWVEVRDAIEQTTFAWRRQHIRQIPDSDGAFACCEPSVRFRWEGVKA